MKYYIYALFAMLMWSSSFIATKIAYQAFSPILLCLFRFSISFILLFIYRCITRQHTKITKQDLKSVILSAIGGISIYYTLENTALSLTITYYQMFFGAIGFLPLLLLEHPMIINITPQILFSLLYLSAGCSVGAILLYNHALKGLKASHASVLMNFMPVFGIILSYLILHENITITQIIGGIIILFGVIISTKKENA